MQPNKASQVESSDYFRLNSFSKKLIYLRPENHRLAIMQPYIFPYLGYFHLIESTDEIVFYDDVNFIKRGWINRNRILLNGKEHLFTIPIEKVSQNKLINESYPKMDDKYLKKFFDTLQLAYKKAPFYKDVLVMIEDVFDSGFDTIADLAIFSIVKTYEYLGKDINYLRSSICAPETKGFDKAERLIAISHKLGYKNYVNATGGKELYAKDDFKEQDITLSFVKTNLPRYSQFKNDFVTGLSIIDILMFNSPEKVLQQFKTYELE